MPVNMDLTVIGPTLNIVGEINANEKLIIEGKVSTKAINLPGHSFTVGLDAVVEGDINCDQAIILGQLKGNIKASKEIYIGEKGTVDGDIESPYIKIEPTGNLTGRMRH
ncbi:MAG: polymer-forming cytoskeletal protein [Leptospiraceae bacterium]|nr:polymer-forming cytoskeletal protein [Leptospiraceae bacterium]MCB1305316.1 polymer-forming cytoskeletal protein [Leptospiraceae bacterium]